MESSEEQANGQNNKETFAVIPLDHNDDPSNPNEIPPLEVGKHANGIDLDPGAFDVPLTTTTEDSSSDPIPHSSTNITAPVTHSNNKAISEMESSVTKKSVNLGALGGLNVYDSDSEDVPDEVMPVVQNCISKNTTKIIPNKYRDIDLTQTDDSDSSLSDSEDSSSSSSESSSSDAPSPHSEPESICEARSKNTNQHTPPRTEGELLLDDLPPIEDLHITVPEQECMEVGKVSGIVDKMVVVQAMKNTPALDLDSVLFLDKGRNTLGRIFDVIGPVCEPAYCVRFNSTQQIQEKGIEKGLVVYCAPKTDHTSYVFLGELLKMKGSDASWKANNEPPKEFLEFSDDEEERRARRRKRQASGDSGTSGSALEIVEPSSYERRMNAKNAARSRLPSTEPQRQLGRGRGWIRPGVVIPNVHSTPQFGHPYVPPPQPPRPSYAMPHAPPMWQPQVHMPMFPGAVPPIPPPYQFGMGTGNFFSMTPPNSNFNTMLPNLFSTPPPPPPAPPQQQNPYHQRPF